jgi:hypothetical protein
VDIAVGSELLFKRGERGVGVSRYMIRSFRSSWDVYFLYLSWDRDLHLYSANSVFRCQY